MTAIVARGPDPRGAVRARRIGPFLLRPLWRIRLHGGEHVPAGGPVILAGNHTGFLDGPLIVGLSPRPVHFMVKQEMFKGPLDPALRWLSQISVDRAGADRTAVLAALGVLEQHGVLGVFPEGTRSAGDFDTMHNGLAYFALRSRAPVVPVACLGSGERGRTIGSLPRPGSRLDLVYGPPIDLRLGPADGAAPAKAGRRAVAEVSELLREALRAHLERARRATGRAADAQDD
jgi:1-acyl-sn-glycerol-3-phosphate acyltransferase